ncbi:MAG: chorismate mutase [Patescibacteria group bacterium]
MNEIENLRGKIDQIDGQILELLSDRFACAKKIGEFKKKNGLPILDQDRWQELIADRMEFAKKIQLPEGFLEELLELIHKYSIRAQE